MISNKQYSYLIDNIGRVHIEITNNLVTGIHIDDNVDFYYNRITHPIVEDDYIIKIGIELIKYSNNKITDLTSIPIGIKPTKFMDKFYSSILSIPYGSIIDLNNLITKGQLSRASKLLSECPLQIIIPIHRVNYSKLDKNINYYLDKLRLIENKPNSK